MLAALLYFSIVFFSCPAHAFLCAGGGRQGQPIKPGKKFKKSRATAKSALFAVSKDAWDTKEDTGKSMKNAL